MSSIFSRSSSKARKPDGHSESKRHRKPSVRKPVFNFSQSKDVVTETALEVTRQMLLNTDVNTQKFFKSARDSNLDINMSDTTLLVSAAILDHIGNQKAADRCLAQSRTISSMYAKMGLNNEEIRSMFVTAMFCLNPFLVKMIESALRVSVNRLAKETDAIDSKDKLIRAIRRLSDEGTISAEESKSILIENKKLVTPNTPRELSFSKTPTELIGPDDSASKVEYGDSSGEETARITTERDLHRYLRRTRPRDRANFSKDYPKERKPTIVQAKNDKHGVDYSVENDMRQNLTSLMSEILAERKAGSNVPITPSTRKASSSDESAILRQRFRDSRRLPDEPDVPDMLSELTMRKEPISNVRANIDPSVVADIDQMMEQFEVATFSNKPMTKEPDPIDDLLDDLF